MHDSQDTVCVCERALDVLDLERSSHVRDACIEQHCVLANLIFFVVGLNPFML